MVCQMTSLRCPQGHTFPVLSGFASCPTCGSLLDPAVDIDKLKRSRTAAGWRALWKVRASSTTPADASGVWRFRDWVLPELPAKYIVTLGEGRSPLIEVPLHPRMRVLVKQCGQQPTGSFKDLGMTVLVSAAKKMAARALLCASTGDTSAALAAYGARAGIPVVVLLPRGKVSPAQLLQPLAHGARVVELDTDFDGCMRIVQELAGLGGFLLANSKNPLRLLGQQTVAFEMAADLGWRVPDVVIVPSGNLGNVFALHLGFTLLRALGLTRTIPRLVAAQVTAADPLHRARVLGMLTSERVPAVIAGETLATAIRIGDPVSYPRARRALLESKGTTTSASEAEVIAAMAHLDRAGLLCCPQTGAAVAGLAQLVEQGAVRKGALVVIVSTASGLKFVEGKASVERALPLRAAASARAVLQVLA